MGVTAARSFIHRILLSLTVILAANLSADAQEKRVWHHKNWKAEAVLVSQDTENCVLRGANNKELEFPKRFFSKDDQNYLRVQQLIADDREQWALVSEALPNLVSHPDVLANQLIVYHKKYPDSPYAGLIAGIARCVAKNEFKTAGVMFREVQRRIEIQREVRPNVHPLTMASSLNNEAVCRIKELKGGAAAASLLKAAEETRTAIPAVSHNGITLAKVAAGKESMIVLPQLSRTKLFDGLAASQAAYDTTGLPPGYYYSQLMDEPPPLVKPKSAGGASGGTTAARQVAAQVSFNGRSLATMGSGWVVAPQWVVTNRHVAAPDLITSPTIAVLDDPAGSAQKIAADKVLVSTDPALDLALLHVPSLNRQPLPLVTAVPPQATQLMVLGYPQATQFGLSLMTHSGVISKRMPGQPVIVTDAKVSDGNSGGPAVDQSGNVIGVAFARHLGGSSLMSQIVEEKRGLLVDSVAVTKWISSVQPSISLAAPSSQKSDWPKLVKQISPSVLPILIYADPADVAKLNSAKSLQTIGQTGGAIDPEKVGMMRDHWCVACEGSGRVKCRNRGCGNGVVSVPKRVVVGSGIGGPVYGTVREKQRCPVCSGRGAWDCKQCNNGRI